MKFSIITVSYNAASTIGRTIESVIAQQDVELEYIIIDGNSTDATLDIVRQYADSITHLVSEPDEGIYDAMNKGVALATGDYIGILNADDMFAYSHYLADAKALFASSGADLLYSNLTYVKGNENTPIRHWKAGDYRKGLFKLGWMPPHPTVILKKEVYDKAGGFNTQLKISADYEFLLRVVEKYGFSPTYINKTGVLMQVGGVSNSNFKNRWLANQEDVLAWTINGLKPPKFLRLMKPLRKVNQFFKIMI